MKKQYKPILILSIVILGMWIFASIYNSSIETEIDKNRYQTVAKVYDISYGAKNVSIEYKFRYDNRIYLGKLPVEKAEKTKVMNKYFRIDVSTINPDKNKLYLDQEITSKDIIKSLNLK